MKYLMKIQFAKLRKFHEITRNKMDEENNEIETVTMLDGYSSMRIKHVRVTSKDEITLKNSMSYSFFSSFCSFSPFALSSP